MDDNVEKMVDAIAVIADQDQEALKLVPGMKEVIFFFIILTMFKEKMLNGLYTHVLEYFLDGAKQLFEDGSDRSHIDTAIQQLKRYPMTANPPGICIIFSMLKDREGSKEDVIEVKKVFEDEFNYDVFVKINPTKKEIKMLIDKLSAPRNMFYDRYIFLICRII